MTTASPSDEDDIKDDANARAAYAAIAARSLSHNHSMADPVPCTRCRSLSSPNCAWARLDGAGAGGGIWLEPNAFCRVHALDVQAPPSADRRPPNSEKTRVPVRVAPYHDKPDFDHLGWFKRLLRSSSTNIWIGGFGVLAAVAFGSWSPPFAVGPRTA